MASVVVSTLLLAVSLVTPLVIGSVTTPASAATTPWTCSAYAYLFQTPGASHFIQQVDLATGGSSLYGTTPDAVNAVGYNTLDNYMYGWDVQTQPASTQFLIRINSDGTLTNLGFPAGINPALIGNGYIIGDFDGAGHLYMMSANGAWAEIDLAPGSPTYGTAINTGVATKPANLQSFPGDWTYINGLFWGVAPATNGVQVLVRFNPATGGVGVSALTTPSGLTGFPTGTTQVWGASYTDAAGDLFVQNNTSGLIYKIDVSTAPAAAVGYKVATGPISAGNDGARCANAVVPTITVTKTVNGRVQPADQFTVGLKDSSATTLTSVTTTGTNTTASTVDWPVSQGATYTITDAMAAGSTSALSAYGVSIACADTQTGQTVSTGGSTGAWTLTVSSATYYTCNITNAMPAISIVKSASVTDANGDGLTDAGDTIQWSFVVTNTGQATLNNVGVTDNKAGTVSCPSSTLAPGASETCTAVNPYTITAADQTAGMVTNTATANGIPVGQTTAIVSSPSSTTTPLTAPAPALSLVKSASPNTPAAYTAGQPVT